MESTIDRQDHILKINKEEDEMKTTQKKVH